MTPSGEVWATQEFRNMIDTQTDPTLDFDDLGERPLAKKFGSARLYRLRRRNDAPLTSIDMDSREIAALQQSEESVSIDEAMVATETDFRLFQILRNKDNVDILLQSIAGFQPTVWKQLISYRILLRVLLIKYCRAKNKGVTDNESITSMLSFLQIQNVNADFIDELRKISDITYFAEWTSGTPPYNNDIKELISKAPVVLRRLANMI